MSDAAEPHRIRSAAKRAVAPLERRIEIAVTRAVEAVLHREIEQLRESMRADMATMVELSYELERLARHIDERLANLAAVTDSH